MARVAMRGPLALLASNSKAKIYPPIVPTGKDGADPAMIKLAADAQVDIAPGKSPAELDVLGCLMAFMSGLCTQIRVAWMCIMYTISRGPYKQPSE